MIPVIMANDNQPMISYSNHSSISLCYGDHFDRCCHCCWLVGSTYSMGFPIFSTVSICLKCSFLP